MASYIACDWGAVPFCVTYFSGGRAIIFQLIAILMILAGIVIGDSLSMLLIGHLAGEIDITTLKFLPFYEDAKYWLLYDNTTALCYVGGIAVSLCIWK